MGTAAKASSPVWQPSSPRLLGFAVLSSLGILALTFWTYPFFDLPPLPEMGISPRTEVVRLHEAAYFAFYTKNSSALFAVIGAILGLLLGLLAAQRRPWAAALSGCVGGAALGALGGLGSGVLLNRALWLSEDESLVTSFGIHLLAWGPTVVGAVGGVALLQNSIAKAVAQGLGGILAALFVVAGYCVSASIIFQNSNLTYLYPDNRSVQVFWGILCPLLVALGLMLTLSPRNSGNADAQSTGETA